MTPLEYIREANQNLNHRVFWHKGNRRANGKLTEAELDQLVTDGYLEKEGQLTCLEGHVVWTGTMESLADNQWRDCKYCLVGEDRYEPDDDHEIQFHYKLIKDFDKNDPVDPNHWFARLYVHW